MSDSCRYMIHEYLEGCYDVQLELEDLNESFETLVLDIELIIRELSENLERVRDHLQEVEDSFDNFNNILQQETSKSSSQKLLQD